MMNFCVRYVPMNLPWLGRTKKFCGREVTLKDGKWWCPLHGYELGERTIEQEISEKLNSHCFKCGLLLVLKGAYFECPEHKRQWLPENLRY